MHHTKNHNILITIHTITRYDKLYKLKISLSINTKQATPNKALFTPVLKNPKPNISPVPRPRPLTRFTIKYKT